MSTLSPEEVMRFLEVAQDTDYYVYFATLLYTGLRRGELLALRWRNLDLDSGVLTVVETAYKLGNVPIVGGSGGVPSTLACAYKIPERLTSVGVLFGPRPLNAPGATAGWSRSMRIRAFLGRNGPLWIGSLAMKAVARTMRQNPDRALTRMFEELPESDKEALNYPDARQQYIDTILEAFRSGTRGVAMDYALTMKPWGFRLEDIHTKVYLWHGEDDTVTPPAMGRYLSQAISNCKTRFIPGEGHFSLLPNYVEEILNTLVSSDSSSQ